MIELRFVIRDSEKVLQFRYWPSGMLEAWREGAPNVEPAWADVPLVEGE